MPKNSNRKFKHNGASPEITKMYALFAVTVEKTFLAACVTYVESLLACSGKRNLFDAILSHLWSSGPPRFNAYDSARTKLVTIHWKIHGKSHRLSIMQEQDAHGNILAMK
jgi:hypothetical protein